MDANERRERVGAEAAEWWVRLQSQEVPRAERGQFIDWLRESHVHVAEMLRVAQVHNALERFERWTRIVTTDSAPSDDKVMPFSSSPLPLWERVPEGRVRGASSPSRLWLAASAAVLLLSCAFLWSHLRGQTLVTDRAERRELVLADGTAVRLDPETQLRLKYTADSRRVILDHGRALFRVARDSHRGFLVEANKTTVRALGTAFGVERERGRIIVTVSEGKVAISALPPPSIVGEGARAPGRAGGASAAVELTANQQITVPLAGSPAPVRQVDSSRALAWAEGRLVFENHTVGEVVARFNLYNRVQLRVFDEALAQRPVSGVFDASDPESFVAFIQTVANARALRDGDREITLAAP